MKTTVISFLVFVSFFSFAGNEIRKLDNPVFVLNYGLNQKQYTVLGLTSKLILLKKWALMGGVAIMLQLHY